MRISASPQLAQESGGHERANREGGKLIQHRNVHLYTHRLSGLRRRQAEGPAAQTAPTVPKKVLSGRRQISGAEPHAAQIIAAQCLGLTGETILRRHRRPPPRPLAQTAPFLPDRPGQAPQPLVLRPRQAPRALLISRLRPIRPWRAASPCPATLVVRMCSIPRRRGPTGCLTGVSWGERTWAAATGTRTQQELVLLGSAADRRPAPG